MSAYEEWVNGTEGPQFNEPWIKQAFEAGHEVGVRSTAAADLVKTQRDDEREECSRLREKIAELETELEKLRTAKKEWWDRMPPMVREMLTESELSELSKRLGLSE